ncbi:hypothetical protein QJ043_03830 [Olsenella sp. YH-ols2217]|uniref:YtxH domain-containing protein n=1 Tax=Kribbibacterium absianum TaxID=3044210 RepID=A0ABT6ZJI7_9ACTN|nr:MULTISPECIES: hypothetical protein [unclassified Olsenella]MDJ1122806.1 hypothetical protein [Olsenella sp. YH-ols2216]MDJ1129211.1 hypothetical protein [Olsenella sp. YH-ols2217]
MTKALGAAVRLGVLAAVAYVGFKTLLTPEAQKNVVTTAKKAFAVGEAAAAPKAPTDAQVKAQQEKVAANQQWVAEQWAKVGY